MPVICLWIFCQSRKYESLSICILWAHKNHRNYVLLRFCIIKPVLDLTIGARRRGFWNVNSSTRQHFQDKPLWFTLNMTVELRVPCCCFDDSKCWYIFILCEKYFYCWKVTIYVFISVNIFTEVTCSTLCLNTFKLMISNYIFYLRLIKYQKYFYGWKVTIMFLYQFVFLSK